MCNGWLVLCFNMFTLVKSSVGLPNIRAGKTMNHCDMQRVSQGCQRRNSMSGQYLQASVLEEACRMENVCGHVCVHVCGCVCKKTGTGCYPES